jgi:hypothetical protein
MRDGLQLADETGEAVAEAAVAEAAVTEAGAEVSAETSAGPGGSGRGRLARAALLAGYGAAGLIVTTGVHRVIWEPKVPKLVGD